MLSGLLDMLLPPACAGCGEFGSPCCRRCLRELAAPRPIACELPAAVPAYALAAYRGAARQLVLGYKERGRRDLGPVLGERLADACLRLPEGPPTAKAEAQPPEARPSTAKAPPPVILVPAPSRAAASRVRGGPHVQLLAAYCAATLASRGVPAAVAPALRFAAGVRDAASLDAARRAANVAGRVLPAAAGAPPPGSAVILLDDVLTTGATAAACVRALTCIDVTVRAVVVLTSPRLPRTGGTESARHSLTGYEPS